MWSNSLVTQDLSVLVVDDDDLQRRFLAALLDRAGVGQLYWANNGRTALEMFRRGPQVDIVVCDLLMPEMDGQTFLTMLHDEGHSPSVVIASGADLDMTEQNAMACNSVGGTVHDHVIVGKATDASFRSLGLL